MFGPLLEEHPLLEMLALPLEHVIKGGGSAKNDKALNPTLRIYHVDLRFAFMWLVWYNFSRNNVASH